MSSSDDLAAAQAAEYETWVAVQPIDHDGARAYNVGDPVPASNVTVYGYDADGLVKKRSTKAAAAALDNAAKG